jgi:hypothetical protein
VKSREIHSHFRERPAKVHSRLSLFGGGWLLNTQLSSEITKGNRVFQVSCFVWFLQASQSVQIPAGG